MTRTAVTISITAFSLSSDLRQAINTARVCGFDGLTIDPSRLDPSARTRSGRRDVSHLFSSVGLRLVALNLDLPPRALLDSKQADRALAETLQALELARGLNASMVVVDLGSLPEVSREAHGPQTPPPPAKTTPLVAGLLLLPSEEETARYGAARVQPAGDGTVGPSTTAGDDTLVRGFLDEVATAADRLNTAVAFGSSLSSLSSLEAAISTVSLPLLGVDIDPPSLVREGLPVDDVFGRLSHRVLHLRGRDAVGGSGGRLRDVAIGQGDIRWKELLDAGLQLDRVPPITIDPRGLAEPRTAAVAGLGHLRSLLG